MSPSELSPQTLLRWYDQHARSLPWRFVTGTVRDPYQIWLAEIMLQQTTVVTAERYFRAFVKKWRNFEALAAADDQAVMQAWAGLGYYARARNMLKCARIVATEYSGKLPPTPAKLLQLPGIGPYTAAAIAAIAFDVPTAPVDGNIERVLARFYGITRTPPALKVEVQERATALIKMHDGRSGDFAQAMMDLGATICTPRTPNCAICPWQAQCIAYREHKTGEIPHRPKRTHRPTRKGTIWWVENQQGAVLMTERPPRGLLGGMLAFPSSGWDSKNDTKIPESLPQKWKICPGQITHIFTHFQLLISIQRQIAPEKFQPPSGYQWISPRHFNRLALPSLMQKIAAHMNLK